MKTSLVHVLLISFSFFCLFFVESQSSDSCASKLTVARLIPVINTTFLSCLTPLRSANFVLRVRIPIPYVLCRSNANLLLF